ncbi:Kinesin-like protein kif21b [Chytriomyces hyalinus]|nr:Kinesin-like protein kif21b [Chytriomyces hyalinus]
MDPKPETPTHQPTRTPTNDSSVRVAVRIRSTSTNDACFTDNKSKSAPDTSCSFIVPNADKSIRVLCPSNASTLFATSPDVSSSAVVAAAADVDWEYDSVWDEDSNQASIFESEVSPLVSAFIEGFNTTLFAYGQTGSGKTFTMGTAVPDLAPKRSSTPSKPKEMRTTNASGRSTPTSKPSTPSKPRPLSSISLARPSKPGMTPSDSAVSLHDLSASSGMIPRAIQAIFNKLETIRSSDPTTSQNETLKSHSMSVSFLELHNEEWVDLLKESKPANTAKKPPTPSGFKAKASLTEEVSVREDKEGRIAIHGATSVVVESAEAAIRLLAKGSKLRSTAATSMNESSSRSHAIFSLSLTSTQMTHAPKSPVRSRTAEPQRSNNGLVITSKFHFVDLAGSERLKRTQNTGDRKTEGICINQGLLVLGRVINCLSQSKPNNPDAVVPYRDSKLTRFLQDSLGGNSKTVMLACVSSLESDLSESINTLRYASRARGIQNKSRITIDTSGANSEIVPLLSEIALLKSLLAEANLAHAADEMAIVRLQSDLEAAVAGSAAEEKVRSLEVENERLLKQLSEAESATLESKELIKDLEAQWKLEQIETRRENDVLVQLSEIRNCSGDVLDLEMEVDSLKNKLKASQDYASLIEDTLSTQTAKEAENLLQISELRLEIESLGKSCQSLMDCVAQAESDYATSTATITNLHTQQHHQSLEIQLLKHESQQKSIEIENGSQQLADEKRAHEQAKRAIEDNLAALMEKIDLAEQEKTALHQNIAQLETSLKESETRNATLSTQLVHQTKATETAALKASELTQKTQIQESVSQTLRLKLLDSEGRTSHLEAEVVELHRILESQSTELQKTIAEKHALSDLMCSLKSEMEMENRKSSELIHETAETLIQKNSQLVQELEEERSKFHVEKDNLTNLKSRVDQLTEELQRLQILPTVNHEDQPSLSQTPHSERAAPAAEGHDFPPTPQPNLPSPRRNNTFEIRKSISSASLVQRRIAEYGQLKMRAENPKVLKKGASSDDLHDSELVERYQFLLKTVRTVKELFEP